MDRAGLLGKINFSVTAIFQGREWLDTDGLEVDGRINYKNGLNLAIEAFREAQALAAEDLQLLFIAEYTFLVQELEYCSSGDTKAAISLKKAIQEFDEAFPVLEILQNPEMYRLIATTYSQRQEFRYKDMPKDAFHVTCAGHKARLDNILRSPGINLSEKELLRQRYSNLTTAQTEYWEKQRKVLKIKPDYIS